MMDILNLKSPRGSVVTKWRSQPNFLITLSRSSTSERCGICDILKFGSRSISSMIRNFNNHFFLPSFKYRSKESSLIEDFSLSESKRFTVVLEYSVCRVSN
eukprot:NODE_668_length_5368_cov_0.471626.p5 type:complete len:101 gc:universal NODE_668_length_5368_cov_0.471626:4755-5057(+)